MKQSTRSKHFYKRALININNAYDRIRCLEKSLNFQGFDYSYPEIIVTEYPNEHGISLYWNDVILDMESVIIALETNGRITPESLEKLICNINDE